MTIKEKLQNKITTLFCDLGGVLLTNGWGSPSRKKAAEKFGYDSGDFESRHRLIFGDYEEGKITLDDYLHHVLFYKPQEFTREAYIEFMYQQSQAIPEMLTFIKNLKAKYNLRLLILSNEGLELTNYRIKTFGLREIGDIFVVSCFVKMKKPSKTIYQLALDLAQVPPQEIIYLDDRLLFIEIAQEYGINAIHHQDLETTKKQMENLFKL